jgi:hypothetical protein
MPSEQPPQNNTISATVQQPANTGGVRALLGLPPRTGGTLSTSTLTAPSGVDRYRQLLLPEPEENDPWVSETLHDERFFEGADGAVADLSGPLTKGIEAPERDPQGNILHPPLRNAALHLVTMQENLMDAPTEPPAEQREQTSLVIPGVSTQRTEFLALTQAAGAPTSSVKREPQKTISNQGKPPTALGSLPHAPEVTTLDVELLTRLEQLATEQRRIRPIASALRSSNPVEQMGVPNGERGDTHVARRLTQLQRTVSELAETVSAQAAHMRDESQAHSRDRKTPPMQPMVIIKRSEASSTTTRAFWERSRLSRAHLRTGR